MVFKKEDENYVYNTIGKNVKKYRKLKGLTQVELADQIDYSVSFVSGIESKTHQSFSLGALWRIAIILDVDMYKLCIDTETPNEEYDETKYTLFKCENCGFESYVPNFILNFYFDIAQNFNKEKYSSINNITFKCAKCENKVVHIKNKQ